MEVGKVIIEKSFYKRSTSEFQGDGDFATDWEEVDAFDRIEMLEDDFFDDEYEDIDADDDDDDFDDEDGDGADDDSDDGSGQHSKQSRRYHNRELGMRGENAAVRYLRHVGFEILERNWRCPAGEADIIAQDGDTLVFVEVKTRINANKGFPEEAVDAEKRKRYEKIAVWYLNAAGVVDVHVRFDVIAMLVIGKDRAFLKHYVNAFGVAER